MLLFLFVNCETIRPNSSKLDWNVPFVNSETIRPNSNKLDWNVPFVNFETIRPNSSKLDWNVPFVNFETIRPNSNKLDWNVPFVNSETIRPNSNKLDWNVPLVVLFQIYVLVLMQHQRLPPKPNKIILTLKNYFLDLRMFLCVCGANLKSNMTAPWDIV